MFLELKNCGPDGRENHHVQTISSPVTRNSRIPQDYIWRTYLSPSQSEASDVVFSIDDFEGSYAGDIGYIIFSVTGKNRRIVPSSYFPFGGGSRWGSRFACTGLRNKGIAGAIERLILEKFRGYTLKQAENRLSGRNNQLGAYGLNPGESIPLHKYKKQLDRSLKSPHFRIVKFPSWITDPEILQSQESK